MVPDERLKQARLLALAIPVALLGGAYFSQYVGGLHPCEMCWWQRYPHMLAIPVALGAVLSPLGAPRTRTLTLLAALLIAISGAIGVYHAGVELKWWEGLTTCSSGGAKTLDEIMATPLTRCDEIQFQFLGISMAGWNAILSLGGAALVTWLATRKAS